MATPGKEKIMSSRLSTMKFMQRTAAPAPQSAPSTPESRPAKRPRLSEPSRLRAPDPADEQIRDVALEGERKRQQALDKQATDAGDSKWYLDLPEDTHVNGFKVVNAGYTLLDSPRDGLDDGEDEVEATPDVPTRTLSGRKSFGNFNKVIEKKHQPTQYQGPSSSQSDSDSNDHSEDEESHDEDADQHAKTGSKRKSSSTGDEARAKRNAKRTSEKQDMMQQAERRRYKQVKLNKLTSISGSGLARPNLGGNKCFSCGSPDHKVNQCPRRPVGRR